MARIVIVGDGPGGLSAALFLAKNGHEVEVFGKNKTAVNFAQLHNYLGVEDMAGTDFQTVALRQVKEVGAVLHDAEVTSVAIDGDEVRASTDSGTVAADYLILSEGKKARAGRVTRPGGARWGDCGRCRQPEQPPPGLRGGAQRSAHPQPGDHLGRRRSKGGARHHGSRSGRGDSRLGHAAEGLIGTAAYHTMSLAASAISSGDTSRTWVWSDHWWPNGSATTAARSP